MRTSIDDDRVYVLCLSSTYDERLYTNFNCNSSVVIWDPIEFARRCDRALKRLLHIDRVGCVYGSVEYYNPSQGCSLDITDPYNIPFLKSEVFANQQEFRVCFGRKGAFRITKRTISDQDWNTVPDHLNGTPKSHLLRIGDISDIAEIRVDAKTQTAQPPRLKAS